ncbi:MAG: hypothetical protein H6615_11780 [Ignavibacteria bacterium]|nr:hypothetical protein [Ignavibacteria bacterium]
MKLNSKSFINRYYFKLYHTQPNNLCTYFWKYVWAIVGLPFHWMVLFKKKKWDDDYDSYFIPSFTIDILLLLSGALTWKFLEDNKIPLTFLNLLKYYWTGAFIIVGCSAILFSLLFLISWIASRKMGNNVVIEYIKAKKNKYCPRIDWY